MMSRAQVSTGRPDHEVEARQDAGGRNERNERRAERTRPIGIGVAKHEDAGADDHEREQRPDGDELAEQPDRQQAGDIIAATPVTRLATYGVRNFGWTLLNTGGSRPSFDIA